MQPSRHHTPRAWLILLTLLLVSPWARAQGPGEIAIELDAFGVGGIARASSWAGIRLNVTDLGAQPREVMLRLRLTDADGDHPTPTRVIVTNPPLTQGTWLYAYLPRDANDSYEVKAYAAVPDDDGTYRPGRLLGSTVFSPPGQVPPPSIGMFALLGSRYMELSQYSTTFGGQPHPPASHEIVLTLKDLTPADLPDRWLGLLQFDAIVWTQGDPIELSSERAQAMRDWVTRGGHLVVVIPRVGQTWTSNRNPLVDLLPRVNVSRRDNVDLEPYRPLLTDRPPEIVPMPQDATVHVLTPRDDATLQEATPILAGPDGAPVVVRRTIGHGAVTLVGLDVDAPFLVGSEAIDPDVFWHRVLGRRGDLLKTREMTELQAGAGGPNLRFPSRNSVAFDGGIDSEIAKTGRAAAGVLLGFVVFVLFWIVAGPGGFALLKSFGQVKHAWLGYALATGVFTVIAWGGATLIKPSRVDVSYVRFLDHVYDQPVQRARTWASVLIPWYGNAVVSIGPPDEDLGNAIAPWRPSDAGGTDGGFPDARDYAIYATDTSFIRPPTRATVKNVMADWLGPNAWAMPGPVPYEGQDVGEIRLLTESEKLEYVEREGYSKPDLAGVLVHDLPAALEDVLIVVVRNQLRLFPPRASQLRLAGSPLLAEAYAYRRVAPWEPGQPLDLLQATSVPVRGQQGVTDRSARAYLESLLPRGSATGLAPRPGDIDLTDRLTALALYTMLEPPDPADRAANTTRLIVSREQSHMWDLGRWFTQPCVIIIGHIPDLKDPPDTPAPIYVDGRRAPMRGRTVVRWVYPLPPGPPEFPPTDG